LTVPNLIEYSDKLLEKLSVFNAKLNVYANDIIIDKTIDGKVKLDSKLLAQLEDLIFERLKEDGFLKDVSKYTELFNQLDKLIIEEQVSINDLKINRLNNIWDKNNIRDGLLQKANYSFSENGLKYTYINAVSNLIREQSFLNVPIKEAQKILKEKIIEKDITGRYVKTTVIDTMRQYDGAFSDAVKKEFGFENIKYIGDLLETSRPICFLLVDKYKGRISLKELKVVLDEYIPKGKPSKAYVEIDGENKQKGAGMIEGTNINNFCENCGGYGCRHRALPTK